MRLGTVMCYAYVISMFFIGSTHSCNTTTLNVCSFALLGKTESDDLAVPCSNFKVCVNNVANCALDTAPGSSTGYFAPVKALCDNWINKDWNGVSTLTPCLTFIMAIMFAVMTFTRMMT